AALVVVPCALLLLWRYSYYGDLLPNAYHARLAMPWHEGFRVQLREQGIPFVVRFWSSHLWLLFLVVASMAFAVWQRLTFLIVVHAALVLYQDYFAFVGGDWMPQFRWYAPIVPIYLALVFPMLLGPVRPGW